VPIGTEGRLLLLLELAAERLLLEPAPGRLLLELAAVTALISIDVSIPLSDPEQLDNTKTARRLSKQYIHFFTSMLLIPKLGLFRPGYSCIGTQQTAFTTKNSVGKLIICLKSDNKCLLSTTASRAPKETK
jgi:hypothetical protein